jgi:pimeloyl-ACP methyl ester carboxylesterase
MKPVLHVYPCTAGKHARVLLFFPGYATVVDSYWKFFHAANPAPDTVCVVVGYGTAYKSFDELVLYIWDALVAMRFTENIVLAGFSMGGFVAQTFYKHHPREVIGMVLLSSGCAVGGTLPLTARGRIVEFLQAVSKYVSWTKKVVDILPAQWQPFKSQPREHAARLSKPYNTQMRSLLFYMYASQGKSMESVMAPLSPLPVLVMHGGRDDVLSVHAAMRMHSLLPSSTLVIRPGATHSMIFTDSAFVSGTMHDWIAKNTAVVSAVAGVVAGQRLTPLFRATSFVLMPQPTRDPVIPPPSSSPHAERRS